MERKTVTRDKYGNVIRVVEVHDNFARNVFFMSLMWRIALVLFALGMIAGAAAMWFVLPHSSALRF
jgi:hypothetical protein